MYTTIIAAFLLFCLSVIFGLPISNPYHQIPPGTCGLNKYHSDAAKTTYIVGGRVSKINGHPWQVSLQQNGEHSCGGTIISDQHVLTAAHCFHDAFKASYWRIVAGKHSMAKGEPTQKTYTAALLIRHKNFVELTYENDIAMVKLSSKIVFNDAIQPVCLPQKDMPLVSGLMGIITGWGTTEDGGNESALLQEAEVPIIGNERCSQLYSDAVVDNGMVCAGLEEGGKDTCQGDSGGPMTVKLDGNYTLAGITSWSYGCARKGRPGVYVRVPYFIDWINAAMLL